MPGPAVLALLATAALTAAMLWGVAPFAVEVLRHWDPAAADARQIARERRTHLLSTLVALVLAAKLGTLLLFVFAADRMAVRFVGAMCAAGTLNVNGWGYPALGIEIAVFFAAALWLLSDGIDRRGWDYPLIRWKHALLLALVPLATAGAVAQFAFFLGLDPDVVTSCCSTLFSDAGRPGLGNDLAALDPAAALGLLAAGLAVTAAAGGRVLRSGRGGTLYALASAATFVLALAAVIAALSLYVYEHPHHHCPFCLLKREYGSIGYALYAPLFAATALALGVPVAEAAARSPGLGAAGIVLMRRLAGWSLAGFALFAAVSALIVARSALTLFESLPGGLP